MSSFVYQRFREICLAITFKLLEKYVVFPYFTLVRVSSVCKWFLCRNFCFWKSKPKYRTDCVTEE